MQLSHLRYFVKICESDNNMTNAARELHVSQPAISRAVSELETELGVRLFRREKQRIEPTSAGSFFYNRAKDILRQLDELPRLVQQQSDSKLILGIHQSIQGYVLEVVLDFSMDNSDITILTNNSYPQRKDLMFAINNKTIDVAVVVLNSEKYYQEKQDINVITISHSKTVYAISAEHPLANRDYVTLEEMGRYPLYGHVSSVVNAMKRRGVESKLIIGTHDMRIINKLIAERNSGAILLKELAENTPGMVALDYEGSVGTDIAIIMPKELPHAKRELVYFFADYVKERMENKQFWTNRFC